MWGAIRPMKLMDSGKGHHRGGQKGGGQKQRQQPDPAHPDPQALGHLRSPAPRAFRSQARNSEIARPDPAEPPGPKRMTVSNLASQSEPMSQKTTALQILLLGHMY